MKGILVHGNNHFIVSGPLPNRATALALVRQWSIIEIGAATSPGLEGWRIITKEFRENLEWAVRASGEGNASPAVSALLDELVARGIPVYDCSTNYW